MASIKPFVRETDIKKDGRVQVYLQLIHLRKVKYIPLDIHVNSNAFDFGTLKCTPKHNQYLTYNAKISQKVATAEAALIDLSDNAFSADSLTDHIKRKLRTEGMPVTLSMVAQELVEHNIAIGSPGNGEVIDNVVKGFNKWNGGDAILTSIDYKCLLRYKKDLIVSGVKVNTISNYLRTLRAVFKHAIKTKQFPSGLYPFETGLVPSPVRGKNKSGHTTDKSQYKKTITALEKIAPTLSNVYQRNQSEESFMQLVAYCTLLQFYFQGCNFQDIVLAKRTDIKNGYWVFKRYKNRNDQDPATVTVKIIKKAQKIMDLYDSEYIIPVCDDFDVRKELTHYKTRRKNFNRSLASLCKRMELKTKLTSYDMRYYWATIADNMGVSETNRMRAQGQKIPGVAEGYPDSDQIIIDKINEKVTK